jgi:hypothetical protein
MTALLAFLARLVADVLGVALRTPKETGRVTYGNLEQPTTDLDRVRERARRSGLLGLVVVVLGGCATREVVVATMHPVDDQTQGFPRVAQAEVRVILDGTDTVGVVSPAGGYFLIHEADLRALLKR